MKALQVLPVAILASTVAGAVAIYAGFYDIGADEAHWPMTAELVEFVRERSIAVRAATIEVPALDDAELIAEGAQHYAAMCSACHLAPGLAETELRTGLYPRPPDLARHRHAHGHGNTTATRQRQFWIVKHGIKMTAMPAWGTTHDDAGIWSIVAFLGELPQLSPEEYQALTRAARGPGSRVQRGGVEQHEHGH